MNITAVEKAEDALRALMISSRIKQGERLVESRLADQTGLSRNAIREALNRLKNSGLVQYTPYCGYQVRVFELRDYLELYELREAIEPIAARAAAEMQNLNAIQAIRQAHLQVIAATERENTDQADDEPTPNQADRDFHQAILQASGNQRFFDIFKNYYCSALLFAFHLPQDRSFQNPDPADVLHQIHQATIDAHEQILAAIEQGNGILAQELVAKHMVSAKDAFLRHKMPILAKKSLQAYMPTHAV